jgi:hypothetical protein
MKPSLDRAINGFRIVAAAVVLTYATSVAPAQPNQPHQAFGLVDDWTHHHVIFSNPGTLSDAIINGRRAEWERIVGDPRYRMQQIRRGAWQKTNFTSDMPEPPEELKRRKGKQSLRGLWTVILGASDASPALDMYPAKYTFSPIGAPNCTTDFVVFPVSIGGVVNSQGNILGANNLYSSCTGTVPSYLFSYYIGTGEVETSPVLSLNGAEVAFVESVTGGSNFHVLTIGTTGTNTGNTGAPVVPGSGNNAVDSKVLMKGSVSVSRSSPFVDYSHDVAYVGDDTGVLHKFTPVFTGTPAEVTTGGWPFTVASGVILSGPTYDGVSGNIFIGGGNGLLYCVSSSGAACSTPSVTIGTGPVLDAPIVDSTEQTVFAEANNGTNAILSQTTTALASQVTATMGENGTDLYDGAFDNAYFTSVSTGHMYFCGNLATAATPALWRVTFNSSGTMSSTNDGNSFQLVVSGDTGTSFDCTPLTEIYNPGEGHDYLFVGVKNGGFNTGSPNCSTTTCIIGFDLAANFGTITATTLTLSGAGGVGTSGIIIDNVSTAAGASQIYFGAINSGRGEQASQATLH